MHTVTPLDNSNNNNYLDKNIVVSLDDKYVGEVFEEISNSIVVISYESESHDRFEIPKCKVMIWPPSINKKMILDLEYRDFEVQNRLLFTVMTATSAKMSVEDLMRYDTPNRLN